MKILTVLSNNKYIIIFLMMIFTLYISLQFSKNEGSENSLNVEKDPFSTSAEYNVPLNDEQPVIVSDINKNGANLDPSEILLKLNMFKLASVDGDITADENGQLVINRNLRHWIDFYLSAIGELSLVEIQQLMDQQIGLLPMPARQQAEKLLAEYLAYKEALASYENQLKQWVSTNHIENLQQRHDWQKRLRRQILSTETVEAFWKLDELIDDYALEQLVINDSDMKDEEKLYQLQKLDEALPAELKDFRRDLYIASTLQEKVSLSREQGGSDEAVRQLRIEEVGLEAADRLEALEAKQNLWQQRIENYADEVKAVAAIEGLTEQDKNERISLYQQEHFNSKEQLRLGTALNLLRNQ
jgi:lipase chaperone LimK